MAFESNNVKRMRRILEKDGARTIKTHGDALSSGEPDILASVPVQIDKTLLGVTVAIEVKQKGKKPTAQQLAVLQKWARSGAIAFWSDDPEEIKKIILSELEIRIHHPGNTTLENGRPIWDRPEKPHVEQG